MAKKGTKPIWKICAHLGKHSGTGRYWICERCKKGEFPSGCGDFKKALPCFGGWKTCQKRDECEDWKCCMYNS